MISPDCRELNNAMTVPRPTPLNFESGRSGSCRVRRNRSVSITLSPSGGRIFSGSVGPGPTRVATERSLGLVKFRQRSNSHQAVAVAPEHREHRKYRHKAGIPESSPAGACRHSAWGFSPRHHPRSDDGCIGELQLHRLRHEELPCRQPRNSIARRASGAQAALGWSGPLPSQMARSLPPPDRNGKKLKLDFVA